MIKFRTELVPEAIQPPLQSSDRIMVLGSCFAENIGERLHRGGLAVCQNPLGIQYNPLSLNRVMGYLSGTLSFQIDDIFEHQGRFRHWDIHGKLCGATFEDTARHVTDAIVHAQPFLKEAHWLYLTLGSAHVWYRGDRPVGNCHKMPSADFQRKRLSIDDSVMALQRLIQQARRLNPGLHILMTVSPVRYKRDGFIESQRSKSVLLLAIERLCHTTENVHYFPAYELIMDDLRDYRFFERDLLHPSDEAVDYIWDKFQQCAVSSAAISSLKEREKAWRRNQHIPSESQNR